LASSQESNTWDVIVVGAGGAGLSAAAEAAALGRAVLLLEKNRSLGGATSWAVGTMTATRTSLQKRAGIDDTREWHFEDLSKHNGALDARDNLALRRILVDQSTDALDWLRSLGVVFVGPMPEPPHRVARMHNIVPSAKGFAHCLARHCRKLKVEIRTSARVSGLTIENGRVVGVECRTDDGKKRFVARQAVVLASGDYSADRDLKAHFAGAELAELDAVVTSSTGDGHKLALALGARVINGDIIRGPVMRFLPPRKETFLRGLTPYSWLGRLMAWGYRWLPKRLLRPFMMGFLTTALGPTAKLFQQGAILVNVEGRRFCDELDQPAHELPKQPYKIAYILFDRSVAAQFQAWPNFISTAPGISYAYLADYKRSRGDVYHCCKNLAKLAVDLAMPIQTLERTLESYNASERGSRPALERGPFYALGPIKSYCVFADGGLKVSNDLEVLGVDDRPIPGLYAAGSVGQGGLLLEGHGHHLAWAFVSGRIAGRNAARHP